MTRLQFHPGDKVRVVDLTLDKTFATHCGLPISWSNKIATVTKAVEVYGGSYYYLNSNRIYRFPARALELIEGNKNND